MPPQIGSSRPRPTARPQAGGWLIGAAGSLALRLSLDLTEAMDGTLRCERTPGGGRTAVVTLPAAARRTPAAPAGTQS